MKTFKSLSNKSLDTYIKQNRIKQEYLEPEYTDPFLPDFVLDWNNRVYNHTEIITTFKNQEYENRAYLDYIDDSCGKSLERQALIFKAVQSLAIEYFYLKSLKEKLPKNIKYSKEGYEKIQSYSPFKHGAVDQQGVDFTLDGKIRLKVEKTTAANIGSVKISTDGIDVGLWKLLFSSKKILDSEFSFTYYLEKPQEINTLLLPFSLPIGKRVKSIFLYNSSGQCVYSYKPTEELIHLELLFSPVEVYKAVVIFKGSEGVYLNDLDQKKDWIKELAFINDIKNNNFFSEPIVNPPIEDSFLHLFYCPIYLLLREYKEDGLATFNLSKRKGLKTIKADFSYTPVNSIYKGISCFINISNKEDKTYESILVPESSSFNGSITEYLVPIHKTKPFVPTYLYNIQYKTEELPTAYWCFYDSEVLLSSLSLISNQILKISNPLKESIAVTYNPILNNSKVDVDKKNKYWLNAFGYLVFNEEVYKNKEVGISCSLKLSRVRNNKYTTPVVSDCEVVLC